LVIDHASTSKIIEEKEIHHVIFTGSVSGGRTVYQSVAEANKVGFIDCNLELGGKDGAYVASDADVKAAAVGIVEGAMYNAGQSCCGIERAYVHADVYDEFITHCGAAIEAYVLGDPSPSWTLHVYRPQRGPVPTRVRVVFDALVAHLKVLCRT